MYASVFVRRYQCMCDCLGKCIGRCERKLLVRVRWVRMQVSTFACVSQSMQMLLTFRKYAGQCIFDCRYLSFYLSFFFLPQIYSAAELARILNGRASTLLVSSSSTSSSKSETVVKEASKLVSLRDCEIVMERLLRKGYARSHARVEPKLAAKPAAVTAGGASSASASSLSSSSSSSFSSYPPSSSSSSPPSTSLPSSSPSSSSPSTSPSASSSSTSSSAAVAGKRTDLDDVCSVCVSYKSEEDFEMMLKQKKDVALKAEREEKEQKLKRAEIKKAQEHKSAEEAKEAKERHADGAIVSVSASAFAENPHAASPIEVRLCW